MAYTWSGTAKQLVVQLMIAILDQCNWASIFKQRSLVESASNTNHKTQFFTNDTLNRIEVNMRMT